MHNFLINGFKKSKALFDAGYTAPSYRVNPGLIFDTPKFKAELERRLGRIQTKHVFDENAVVAEIYKVAFANFGDYAVIDWETGDTLVDLRWCTQEQLAAIGEYTVETYKEGRGADAVTVKRARIKTHGKLEALNMLMKYHNAYKDSLANGDNDVVAILLEGRKRMGDEPND